MRIDSITLRNFRGVEEAVLRCGEGVTIVEGPNEIGKSSLAEGFRLIRNFKASSRNRAIISVKPIGIDKGPEVECDIRTGNFRLRYHKRWLVQPFTTLAIYDPYAEQLSGDEAHEKFFEILSETVDMDLLAALDVTQGHSLDQAALAEITSLQHALDDSSVDFVGEDAVLTRVSKEYDVFFTQKGRERGPLKEAIQELKSTEVRCEEQRVLSEEMDKYILEHADFTQKLDDINANFIEAQKVLSAVEQEALALEELQRVVEVLVRERMHAHHRMTQAETERDARNELIKESIIRANKIKSQETTYETRKSLLAATRKEFEEATQAYKASEETRTGARIALKKAQEKLNFQRDKSEYSELVNRLERVHMANDQCVRARAQLKELHLDDDKAKELEELNTALRIAQHARSAATTHLIVQSSGVQPLLCDGNEITPGISHNITVEHETRLEIEGIISLDVQPGLLPAEIDLETEHAKEALNMALNDIGVESLDEARAIFEQKNVLRKEIELAQSALDIALGESSREELEERCELLSVRLASQKAANGSGPQVAEDIVSLEEAVMHAEDVEKKIDTQCEKEREINEKTRSHYDNARDLYTRTGESLRVAREEYTKLTQRLENERKKNDDESLHLAFDKMRQLYNEAESKAQEACKDLEARDPETVAMRLTNAEQRVRSSEIERDRIRKRVNELGALLDERISLGIYDQLSQAESAYNAARIHHDRIRRSADAIALLREIMLRKHDEAQHKYMAPFRDRIERLGRVIFGKDFAVEISPQLEILSRTLAGTTVPFNFLSAGAREQLALIGRLACAQLIDQSEGAPVILDDTLGFSDPDRLSALNVVLNDVGQSTQIIILTCQPKRFNALGGASFVHL